MSDLVEAEWVGPAGYEAIIDGRPVALGPGVIVEISHGEAEASDNWRPVEAKSTKKGSE